MCCSSGVLWDNWSTGNFLLESVSYIVIHWSHTYVYYKVKQLLMYSCFIRGETGRGKQLERKASAVCLNRWMGRA